MASVNKVILIGNVGSDPVIRNFDNGSVVAAFSIATSERYKNKAGETVEQTEWHRLELWEGLAKIAEQYVKKGRQVYVEGKIKTEDYTDKDGVARKITKIRVNTMTLMDNPNKSENTNNTSNTSNEPKQVANAEYVSDNSPAPDDDLPF